MARWFLLLLSGCSLAITGPSADRPRNRPPACDTSKGLVALDGVLAATMGVIALSVAASDNGGEAVAPLIVGGIFAASAIHGNNVVNACNREQLNFESEMASHALPPEQQPERQVVTASGQGVTAPGIAMQPAVLQPTAMPPPLAPPPSAPAPPPPRSDEPWAAFWKEVP